jgi:zinc protease
MFKKVVSLSLLLFIAVYHLIAQPIPLNPAVKYGVLENGLTYYIQENKKPEKRAELRLVVNAGSILEDDDQQGLAHFVEHMAFNGTKNFKKNEIVHFLESVGVRFGADLNAYTSFDETVYMLQIPTDKPELLDKGILILEDWASNITFEGEEIDKERGVIIEEWRTSLGADDRMNKITYPVLFHKSKYAERLPIGKKEILETFKHDAIKRYYKDWYRPELMAIVIVGDIDANAIEAKIKKQFAKIPKSPATARKRVTFEVPNHAEILAVTATDAEAAYTQINMSYKKPKTTLKTKDEYRNKIKTDLYNIMLGQRLQEKIQQAEPPFSYAYTYYGSLTRTKDVYGSFAIATEKGGVEEALKTLVVENQRVLQHGFTPSELERAKKELTARIERAFKEKDKTESSRLIQKYVYHYLTESPAMNIETEKAWTEEMLPNIQLADVNGLAKNWIQDESLVITVTAPHKPEVKIPSKEEIVKMYQTFRKIEVEPYQDSFTATSLIEKLPNPGVIKEEKEIKEIGVTTITLGNGIKVWLKPTNFKDNQIVFSARSEGGNSLATDAQYFTAKYASSVVSISGIGQLSATDLRKYLTGKTVSVSPYIGALEEGLNGNATPQDLETMFQLIHLYFTQPRRDEKAFQSWQARTKSFISNALSDPENYFEQEIEKIISQNHPRADLYPTSEQIDKIDADFAYQFYQERFADASDFHFFIVGSFDVNRIKNMLTTYLGSLPATNRNDKWKDVGPKKPEKVVKHTVKKGTEPKSIVQIHFHGNFTWSDQNRYQLKMLNDVLSIRLTEVLREKESGVYSPQVYAYPVKYPQPEYNLVVRFSCSPENADKLINATFEEIKKLQKKGATAADLQKVKETQARELEVEMKENYYWLNYLSSSQRNGDDVLRINKYLENINKITTKDLKNAANIYLNTQRYVQSVLMPE